MLKFLALVLIGLALWIAFSPRRRSLFLARLRSGRLGSPLRRTGPSTPANHVCRICRMVVDPAAGRGCGRGDCPLGAA